MKNNWLKLSLVAYCLVLTSCYTQLVNQQTNLELPYTAMVNIDKAIIDGQDIAASNNREVFKQGRKVELSAYAIGQYEVTYELWYAILQYAKNHGYEIYNPGQGGSLGEEYAEPNATTKHQPVVKISWNDAIVWTNAYSEYLGKTPVYVYNGKVIKSSWDKNGECTHAQMNKTADGYRLPTEAEWEYAARGASVKHTYEWGDGRNFAGTPQLEQLTNYAWYKATSENKTHKVGSKNSNRLGIYDMSGNVWEWCFDGFANKITDMQVKDPTSPIADNFAGIDINKRQKRGGSFLSEDTTELTTGYRGLGLSKTGKHDLGFRVAHYIKDN